MLDDVEIDAVETPVVDGDEATARSAPVVAGALCTCGSGLAAEVCCSLDLRGLKPAEPTPENQERLTALAEARRGADLPAATELSLTILAEQPTVLDALAQLYLIRKTEGADTAALTLIRRAAALAPDEPRYGVYLVNELAAIKAWGRANAAARRLVRARPDSPLAHASMGEIFTQFRDLESGEHHFRRALTLSKQRSPDLLLKLAHNLQQQGQFDEARGLYREVLGRAPQFAPALIGLVDLERNADALAEAAERLSDAEAMLGPSPVLSRAKARLALHQGECDAVLTLIEAVSSSPDTRPAEDWYMQGQALDKLGRYDEAFAALQRANDLHESRAGQGFDLERARGLAKTAQVFTADEGANGLPVSTPAAGPQPLFVVGFPRSGTTMLEQSLSMHPDVSAGGELGCLPQTATACRRLLGSPSDYPVSLTELWIADQAHQVDLLRTHYLNSAKATIRPAPQTLWFTDKTLTHELFLGFACLLFPASPIIHIVRHPLDVMVSNYANALPHGGFKEGVKQVAEYYLTLLEAAEGAHARNGDIKYMQVRYEDILEDQEGWTRRILDFAGLPFDPACLDFHENKRYARTVSHQQVREKINTKSKARYRNYLKHLGPAIEVLGPAITRLGYAI